MFNKFKYYIMAAFICLIAALSHVAGMAAVGDFHVEYSLHFRGAGWNRWLSDNEQQLSYGAYPNGLNIRLVNQPAGLSGTVLYQVNLSGSGWLEWVENSTETGNGDSEFPLEAIRVKFNGDLEQKYDIHSSVLIGDTWTDWVKNGEVAGEEGVGKRIDGICLCITEKDAAAPEKPKYVAPEVFKFSSRSSIDPSKPMVALTFDDGPTASSTARILDALDAVGGKATFYVVGSSIKGEAANAMKRAAASGHEIGNHTYNHVLLTKQGESARASAISSISSTIQSQTGSLPATFRPPGGAYNSAALNTLASQGLPVILWSIDTNDWKHRNPSTTVNHVLNNVKDGDIVLMHDLYSTTATAAETLIPELVRRGYQLVTISELANARGGMKPGHVYTSFRR